MEGRLNRALYFLHELAIGVGWFVIVIAIVVLWYPNDPEAAELVWYIVGIGANILIAFQIVKRLHDLDRPGSHYWLLLIPFYNIYLSWVLHFKKGTTGPNSYGPDPLTTRT